MFCGHVRTYLNTFQLDSLSIEHVDTLPIGFLTLGREWCVGTEFEEVGQVYRGPWDGVRRVLNMARKWGVGVLVDFHAVCGVRMGMRILGLVLVMLGCAAIGRIWR